MNNNLRVFIGFAAEDRYDIVEPIVHHLKNYGIDVWYDRYTMVLGDNRVEKNLIEGAGRCGYALFIISPHTIQSKCAMEEINIVKNRYTLNDVTVFPVLHKISPDMVPDDLLWVKDLIFKETDGSSGSREVSNHVACKITGDILERYPHRDLKEIVSATQIPDAAAAILKCYFDVDAANLNSRISLLYAAYLTIIHSGFSVDSPHLHMISKIYNRLSSEMKLRLDIDYRDLWLLENTMCILCNSYLSSWTESRI